MFISGISHEYLVKTYKGATGNTIYFAVVNPDTETEYNAMVSRAICGIKVDKIDKKKYVVIIFCPKLIEDFNNAIEEYKKRLLDNVGKYRDFL